MYWDTLQDVKFRWNADSGIVITSSVWYEAGTTCKLPTGTTCTSVSKIRKVNDNIGPNNNTKVSFLDGLPDIWSDT